MRRPPKISVWAEFLMKNRCGPTVTSWRLDAWYPYSNVPATTAHFALHRVNREERMADPIYKVVEVVGTSEQSISKRSTMRSTRHLEHCGISAGSKSGRCAERSRMARFNVIRSL
jgi:hypothetical protein